MKNFTAITITPIIVECMFNWTYCDAITFMNYLQYEN